MTNGVRQILRFNWPFYAAAACVTVTLPALERHGVMAGFRPLVYAGVACALAWTVSSLAASWIVYDVSSLTRWTWVPGAIGFAPRTWVNVHASLDQSTPTLRSMFGASNGRVFDIFDPIEMTEPSIVRARRLARNAVAAERVDFRHLPAAAGSVDAMFLFLAAHELRTDRARETFFSELHRVLAADGRVVVAEHLRDLANLAAYGPGFLHFHSRRTWRRCFERSGFVTDREFSITPFVQVFVLRRLSG